LWGKGCFFVARLAICDCPPRLGWMRHDISLDPLRDGPRYLELVRHLESDEPRAAQMTEVRCQMTEQKVGL
jgi:hypothetical protein